MPYSLVVALLTAVVCPTSEALPRNGEPSHWAVLIAGSNGYYNYRHQAGLCHAYQILRKNGIPEDHIITLSYNDVVNDPENPYPGKLFNKPTGDKPGVDVYEGCKIDYSGKDVTIDNFGKVLTGDTSSEDAKVLESTENDYVFVNFVDHGGSDILEVIGEYLHSEKLYGWLTTMHEKKMYKKLVFYVEACEAGSMFAGKKAIPGQYYVAAANPEESSYGTYCENDYVGGKEIGTCLGDLFSVNWMEDEDRRALTGEKETLEEQYELVRNETNLSHVMQYGDKGFTQDPADEFMGTVDGSRFEILGDNDPKSNIIVESILGEFFGRRPYQNLTEELQQKMTAERERLREIKRTSSIPALMVPIHIEYKKLKKEEGKPSNYVKQLEAARRLMKVVQERMKQLEKRLASGY